MKEINKNKINYLIGRGINNTAMCLLLNCRKIRNDKDLYFCTRNISRECLYNKKRIILLSLIVGYK